MRPYLEFSNALTAIHEIIAWGVPLLQDVVTGSVKIVLMSVAHPNKEADMPLGEHELCIDSHGLTMWHVLIVATRHG